MAPHRLLAHTFARLASVALLTLASLAHAGPGMLRITTSPGDAQIFVNGQHKGNSASQAKQIFELRLPQGTYILEARKSDGKDYYSKSTIFVARDRWQTVFIALSEVTPPAKSYGQAPNGSVKLGGLEWLRCSIGQSWSGSSCTGEAKEYAFDEVQSMTDIFNFSGYDGKRDWRLPTVRELQSLRVCSTGFISETRGLQDGAGPVSQYCEDNASKPTIDTVKFPQTPTSTRFWSSSFYVVGRSSVWYVDFSDGDVFHGLQNDGSFVRLVRAAQ